MSVTFLNSDDAEMSEVKTSLWMRETVMCTSTNVMLLWWNRHIRDVHLIQSGSLGGRFQEEFLLSKSWKSNAQTQEKWSALRYKVFLWKKMNDAMMGNVADM